jgi:hypothetical protein
MITNLSLRCRFDRSNLNASIRESYIRGIQIISSSLLGIGTPRNDNFTDIAARKTHVGQNPYGFDESV